MLLGEGDEDERALPERVGRLYLRRRTNAQGRPHPNPLPEGEGICASYLGNGLVGVAGLDGSFGAATAVFRC